MSLLNVLKRKIAVLLKIFQPFVKPIIAHELSNVGSIRNRNNLAEVMTNPFRVDPLSTLQRTGKASFNVNQRVSTSAGTDQESGCAKWQQVLIMSQAQSIQYIVTDSLRRFISFFTL